MIPAPISDDLVIAPPDDDAALEAATGVVLRSFEGRENAKLGRFYIERWLRSFEEDSVLLLARRDGHVAGLAVGTPEQAEPGRYRRLRGVAAMALLRRPWRLFDPDVLRMAARRLRADPLSSRGDGCWYLALLGIEPSVRGRGVGSTLLRCFETEGRRRGWDRAAVHVRRDSPSTLRFYTSAGWRPTGTTWPQRLRLEKRLRSLR